MADHGQIVKVSKDAKGIAKREIIGCGASVFHECTPGRRKLAVKVVDVFCNDTMTIVEVTV